MGVSVALALGFEDLDEHDHLPHDPPLATLVGKQDPPGNDCLRQPDRGKVLDTGSLGELPVGQHH